MYAISKTPGIQESIAELTAMLRVRRPHLSGSEKQWIRLWVDTLEGVTIDGFGNRCVEITGAPKGAPVIAWSCHLDTVHTFGGEQRVSRDGAKILLHRAEKVSNCLGADCGTGAWLMRQMIRRKIPGIYLFHRAEEIGGKGSRWLAKNIPAAFQDVAAVIALDRKGKSDVITHQSAGRCCSDSFARSLAKQLPGTYRPDSSGLFTDSANYVDLVGECTNLSVGYESAHSKAEWQDAAHAWELLQSLCDLDASKLEFARKPGEKETLWMGGYSSYRRGSYGGNWMDYYGDDWDLYDSKASAPASRDTGLILHKGGKPSYFDLVELVRRRPEGVADMLEGFGYDADSLAAEMGVER